MQTERGPGVQCRALVRQSSRKGSLTLAMLESLNHKAGKNDGIKGKYKARDASDEGSPPDRLRAERKSESGAKRPEDTDCN